MNDPKYKIGDTLTAWFTFSDGHKEASATGQVQSIRKIGDKHPEWLYQLECCAPIEGVPDSENGIYVAWEFELSPTM